LNCVMNVSLKGAVLFYVKKCKISNAFPGIVVLTKTNFRQISKCAMVYKQSDGIIFMKETESIHICNYNNRYNAHFQHM
ncbi:hypothetical protein CHS0354_027577, partial [Potamilus streckersoni]